MLRKIILIVLGVVALLPIIGGLVGIKALQIMAMIAAGESMQPPPEAVATATVTQEVWQPKLVAIGSLAAVQGATIRAELGGRVVEIAFTNGQLVDRGDLLVQIDDSAEQAQLESAQASAELARLNVERNRKLREAEAVPQSTLDTSEAAYAEATAAVKALQATIAKMRITAPFAGRVGLRQVNVGDYVSPGQALVVLQSAGPVYVDFALPQRHLPKVREGLTVNVTTDAVADQTFTGEITAINPQVDPMTRNFALQATLPNEEETLRPGMFVDVEVILPEERTVLAVPATAILNQTYGDSVYVVKPAEEGDGKVVEQRFVRTGARRGDFVELTSGVEAHEEVVTAGVFKLRNGMSVMVNNDLAPDAKKNPTPPNT